MCIRDRVKRASDGAQALEVLDKEYLDLIISDMMMPVMDGYEIVSELPPAKPRTGARLLTINRHVLSRLIIKG